MTDFDDNIFDEFEDEEEELLPEIEEVEEEKKPARNKTFIIAIGVLGAIFVLALIALVVFATIIIPQRNAARQEQAAQINAYNTATSVAATEALVSQQLELTAAAEEVPAATMEPSPTSVVVFATDTPAPLPTATLEAELAADELNARTATVAALLTMAAGGTSPADLTSTATAGAGTTATALPTTGFAEDVGLPGLFGLAVLLFGVILLARRLRASANA